MAHACSPGGAGFLSAKGNTMKKMLIIILGALLLALGFILFRLHSQKITSMRAAVFGPETVINAPIPGTVANILVKKGDIVHKGQILFHLDPGPYEQALAEAKAKAENLAALPVDISREGESRPVSAESLFTARQNEHNARVRMEELSRELATAHITLAKARAQEDPTGGGKKRNAAAIAAAQWQSDQTRIAFDSAKENFEHASHIRAALEAGLRRHDGRQDSVLQALRVRHAELLDQVRNAENNLKKTAVTAPGDGSILVLHIAAGQSVSLGFQAVTIAGADPRRIWIEASFSRHDADRLRPGQSCRISVDGVSKELDGKVDSMGDAAQGNAREGNAANDAVSAKILLTGIDDMPLPGLFPGKKAVVTIAGAF